MPQKSKLNLTPLNLGKGTIGQRLAQFRKERGLTQVQLAGKIGIIQALVSDYERNKLGLSTDMLARFAIALKVSTDEIIGLKPNPNDSIKPRLRLMKRIHKIEKLSKAKQKSILKTLDALIREAEMG